MSRPRVFMLGAALLMAASAGAVAQPTTDHIASWTALMATPIGGLTPVSLPMSRKVFAPERRLAARYSNWSLPANLRNDIAGLSVFRHNPSGNVLSATAAYFHPGCGGCDAVVMLGGEAIAAARSAMVRPGLTAGLNFAGQLAYGHDRYRNYYGTGVSVPIELAADAHRGVLAMTITPGAAIGMVDGNYGSLRTLGGSLAWFGGGGTGIHLSAGRILIPNAVTNVGLAFSWK
jgi:hypothetical protein